MRAFTLIFTFVCAAFAAGTPVVAQEGHPLKGSWIGSWGPAKSHSDRLLVIMNWDGKAITGTINPGTDNIPIKSASLNPDGWVVTIQADVKDKSGAVLNYALEGRIQDLALPDRSIAGTWKNGRETGKFEIQRQ